MESNIRAKISKSIIKNVELRINAFDPLSKSRLLHLLLKRRVVDKKYLSLLAFTLACIALFLLFDLSQLFADFFSEPEYTPIIEKYDIIQSVVIFLTAILSVYAINKNRREQMHNDRYINGVLIKFANELYNQPKSVFNNHYISTELEESILEGNDSNLIEQRILVPHIDINATSVLADNLLEIHHKNYMTLTKLALKSQRYCYEYNTWVKEDYPRLLRSLVRISDESKKGALLLNIFQLEQLLYNKATIGYRFGERIDRLVLAIDSTNKSMTRFVKNPFFSLLLTEHIQTIKETLNNIPEALDYLDIEIERMHYELSILKTDFI